MKPWKALAHSGRMVGYSGPIVQPMLLSPGNEKAISLDLDELPYAALTYPQVQPKLPHKAVPSYGRPEGLPLPRA
jgi:hypothetical protein